MKLLINSNQDEYNSYDLYNQHLCDDSTLSESDRNIENFKKFIEVVKEATKKGDTRPIYVSNLFERLDEATDIEPFIDSLVSLKRQVFIEVSKNYPIERFKNSDKVQIIESTEFVTLILI